MRDFEGLPDITDKKITVDEYRAFLSGLGAKVIRAVAFLEPGYPDHLRPLVSLSPDVFPDSNCIVVAEK